MIRLFFKLIVFTFFTACIFFCTVIFTPQTVIDSVKHFASETYQYVFNNQSQENNNIYIKENYDEKEIAELL